MRGGGSIAGRQRSRRTDPSPTVDFNLALAPHGRGGRPKTRGDGLSARSGDGSGAGGTDSGQRRMKLLRCGRGRQPLRPESSSSSFEGFSAKAGRVEMAARGGWWPCGFHSGVSLRCLSFVPLGRTTGRRGVSGGWS
jgi:hypothetical protein